MNIRQILRPSLREQAAAAERKPKKKPAASPLPKKTTDRLTLSKQALAYISEQNKRAWETPPEGSQDQSSQLKMLEKEQKQLDKCLKIASRLRRGDKVPKEDLNYLLKKDPASYMLAMSQRREKPDPKTWDSVLDEEDRREAEAGDTTLSAASASPGPSTSGSKYIFT